MKRVMIYSAMISTALVVAVYSAFFNTRAGTERSSLRERRFEFTYSVSLPVPPAGAGRVDLWIPYPKTDENQKIYDMRIESDFPSRVAYDGKYGNGILYIGADNPHKTVNATMRFKVVRKEMRGGAAGGNENSPGQIYLTADRLVVINKDIRKLAEKITAGKSGDMEKAKAIYDYVAAFMNYDKSGTGWGNGDTKFCLLEARGNCTDYHSLFLSLTRSIGIPAKFEIGFPLPEKRGGGEITGYHCWAEFFTREGGWIPIDNSEADKHPEKHDYFFGGLDENRVLMSVGRDIELVPKQKGENINYFIYPYAEIDGLRTKNIVTRFSFRDIDAGENMAVSQPQMVRSLFNARKGQL